MQEASYGKCGRNKVIVAIFKLIVLVLGKLHLDEFMSSQ